MRLPKSEASGGAYRYAEGSGREELDVLRILYYNGKNFYSQYGDYGKQPRDNEALISADEQQAQTADIIFDWLILIPDRKCKSEAG